ncbi:MAG: serine/threonine protein kinase, partial [bacterium]
MINSEQLIKAFQIWVHDKKRPLSDILGDCGWMTPASVEELNWFLDRRINHAGGEAKLLENMPDDLCVLHTLAESLKDDDILRASTGANSYFTQTLRMDAAKGPESEAFFKIPDPVEKTVASTGSSDAVNQGKPADIQKTIQNSDIVAEADIQKTIQNTNVEGQAEVAYEPTLVNTGPLSPVDATVQSAPVISSTEEKQPQTPPKNVEKRIEYKTEYVFRSPVDLLGSGSFGIVYRSEDSEFKRKVALKCLKPEHLYHALTPTSFLLEAEINGKLDHPGVLPMYGLGYTDDGVPFYVMKMIETPDLGNVIKEFHSEKQQKIEDPGESNLKFRKLIEHLKSVCLTMHYAHINGVLHCDLKPQNIMTGHHGETYVVDWGSALLINPDENHEEKTGESTVRKHPLGEIHESRRSAFHESQGGLRNFIGGSLAYMAPEHREAHESRNIKLMTPGCDVFSLGVAFYQILTGKLPCRPMDDEDRVSQDRRMKTADYIPPRQLDPAVSKVLSAICMKALAPDPKNRYVSARDFAEDLERWQADEPVSAYAENLRERATRWAKRNRTLVSVIGSSLALITVFSSVMAGVLSQKNSELARKNVMIERREKLAIEAVKEYADAVSGNEQLKNREEFDELRKSLLKSPIEFFRNLNNELRSYNDTRPESVFSLTEGIMELAHLTDAISDRIDARDSYSEAARLLQELSDKDPAQPL